MKGKLKLKGKEYWRSLDQLEQTPEFKEFLHREFPEGASEMNNAWSRRSFITLMGASLALAGLATWAALLVSALPFLARLLRRDPVVALVAPLLLFARAWALGLGFLAGLLRMPAGRPGHLESSSSPP